MTTNEDIAIAAVQTAYSRMESFDPTSETSVQFLTATSEKLAEIMLGLAGTTQIQQAFPGATAAPAVAPPPAASPAPMAAPPAAQQGMAPAAPPGNPAPFPGGGAAPGGVPQGGQPQPVMAPQGGPVAAGEIHANSSNDELWANLVADMQANGRATIWYDNRFTKKTARGADFAHTQIQKLSPKDGRMWPLGLWMNRCPDWAAAIINQYQPPR